jgi:dihydroflavonol-4-reductase
LQDGRIWLELTQGVDFIQHIASPFPRVFPKKENDLIIPAREGTLNILRAAATNKVKRVVITSSVASVAYGKEKQHRNGTSNESSWTNEDNKSDITPYYKSKTIAEKAAWDFIKKDKSGMELATVCPGAILGPVLEEDFGTSANIVIRLLDGSSPALPNIGFNIVDVRSVADLLIRAMEHPEAANQRFIASEGYLKFADIARILEQEYPEKKIPKKIVPDFIIRLISIFDKSLQPIIIDLGIDRIADPGKAKKLLNWKPLPNREAIISCAKSVVDLGLVK